MLQVTNTTPYTELGWASLDATGQYRWCVVIKATFEIMPQGGKKLAENQEPIWLADEFYGEPGKTSVKYESDLSYTKPAAEVIVIGNAVAPMGRPVKEMDVSVRVGSQSKTLRVYGDRIWSSRFFLPAPEPFVQMPLRYERAFGGADLSDPDRPQFDEMNPLGTGFVASAKSAWGRPLPNLEHPTELIKSWKDRPTPAGFGAIGRSWHPRLSYAGTYDDIWMQERCPLWPTDFNELYFLSAPPGLLFPNGIPPGTEVELVGFHEERNLRFNLPDIELMARTETVTGEIESRPVLDTVILEPNTPRCLLVWRMSLKLRGLPTDVRNTIIWQE
ncbi:MAG: hypothetical protein V7641_1845 [Blastocatellia bacterium]